jgi:zinc transport system ATP-binding protein
MSNTIHFKREVKANVVNAMECIAAIHKTEGLVLRVSHLGVELNGKEIIRDLSFDLNENETLVVLGPNGCGKTVLLRALLGLLPYQGSVDWRSSVRIGYVPQRVPLNRDLPVTVKDFFGLKNVSSDEAAEALRQVGVTDSEFLFKQLGLLSSGQFQRVLIAWALVSRPNVLLFDEPTAGIDIGGEETIHTLLKRMQSENRFAVILVTHDLSAVYSEATHVLCMGHKKICYGPPKDVLDPKTLRELYGSEVKFFQHHPGVWK